MKKQEVLHGRMVLPAEYEYGEALDAWAVKKTGMEREEA